MCILWLFLTFFGFPELPRGSQSCPGGCTEAPRGILDHRYDIADDGRISDALIVPPTSQNQDAIEADLRDFVASHLHLDDHTLGHRCEQVIRNYDPCISCATHFLRFEIDRGES